ncbi:MAG: phosphoenolpyruvate synthase [Gemmatimonadetes bacterium]|nr:phosphoenolpyruvate synthase [Gemmatimonadota bacterium]
MAVPVAPVRDTSPALKYVLALRDVRLDDVPVVGGKNASLGEMLRALEPRGVAVPDGFALTAEAFRLTLREAGLTEHVYAALDRLDPADVSQLAAVAGRIREQVRAAPLPAPIAEQVDAAYRALSRQYGEEFTDVAVRSSATAEDLPRASFAGQHESFLNVRGPEALDQATRSCFASLFTDRAISYRAAQGFAHRDVALSVGVQKMVRSDLASGGVIFTLDTETGFREVVLITGAWGIAESVVQGRVRPDEFWVHKPTLRAGFRSIIRREVGSKARKVVYVDEGGGTVREVPVPVEDRRRLVLTDDEVLQLARWALVIEDHYSERAGHPMPMDIEWAKDGRLNRLFIVQARPETAHAQATTPTIALYHIRERGEVLVTGKSVGNTIAAGQARVIRSVAELPAFRPGEVLVAPMTDPAWEPVLRHAAAVVTDEGGRTCHAAIVSREIGIPCVVGTGRATRTLGMQDVTVSCAEGDEGKVYAGRLAFDREEIDPTQLPRPSVPLMLNVGNPENAFQLALLPSAGVGLARIEFIVSSWIGIHPMALRYPERVSDPAARAAIVERTAGYGSTAEFFVDRLASGVGQIGAAFYPRPVIVRFSDFKTSEYAGLLGGSDFELSEGNPMIGFRGASRYYDERYRDGFALECSAIRRVRHDFGLRNVKLMIPFCRTLEEARRVIAELERNGLVRGEEGLEVYVMCEIPNNVILAEEFAEVFDGFSIGSNDLTQLALGVDRDSEIVAHLFDERDPGVKRLIEMVVAGAHRKKRPVGICGQAPSDYPEFAEFLVSIGIDSISLNPDSLPQVIRRLAMKRRAT